MAFQIAGLPGVSAFLQSLFRILDAVIKMGNDHFLPVDTELKEMKSLLRGFEYFLFDGEKRRHLGDSGAERWMDDLKDLLYDIDDLLDEIRMEKLQLQLEITGQPSSSQVRYNFSDGFFTVKDIKVRLGQVLIRLGKSTEEANRLELKRDAVQHDPIWLSFHAKIRQKSGCYADEPLIHGRNEDKNRIIDLLLAEDGGQSKSMRKYEVVCVVGIGGLGKTTLAQLVFQDERIKRFFAVTSWACVSDVFDVIKVAQDLIESACERGDGAANMPSGLPAVQDRLKKTINDKKFLLVLDDVWTTKEWKELKGPLNFGAKGSKILVTTRLRKVAEDLGNKEPYGLEPLEDAQCLKIFNDNAFGGEDENDNDTDFMNMGKEIARKCAGVPLVAKVIGSLLNGEDEGKWKAVKDNDLWNLAYESEDLHPGLRLSYFYLPPFLKRCFEYFALFPSDFLFDRDRIVQMWMAEGLIEVQEGSEPEEIGNQYYNDLKARSLIQKPIGTGPHLGLKARSYRMQDIDTMHDMVHHLACIVSGSSFFRGFIGSSSSTSPLQNVRHAFIYEKLPEVLIDGNKLRTLIPLGDSCPQLFSCKRLRVLRATQSTFGVSHLPSSLRCDFKHLRYLRISGDFLNCTHPDSITTLTNLQVLEIMNCMGLKNLPQDVGKLSNLRFLVLDVSGITGLPDSICKLTNLQVLALLDCKDFKSLPQDLGKLSNLRLLRLLRTGIISLPDSVCSLSKLRVLELSHCFLLKTLPKDVGNLQSLHELNVYGSSISSLPKSVLNATNLRVLTISKSVTLPMHIGKLTKLEQLICYGVGNVNGRGIDELKDMNRLQGSLTIENMENIESAEEALMANLRSKHIVDLWLVWNEFDATLTGRDGETEVRVMEALEPNIAAIKCLSFRNYVGHKLPSWMSTAPGLYNLTQLYLTNLPAITKMTGVEFKSLRFLNFYNCPALREVSMTTGNLKMLIVKKCKELKRASLVILPLVWDALETLECDYRHLDHFLQQLKSANASPCTKLRKLTLSIGRDYGIVGRMSRLGRFVSWFMCPQLTLSIVGWTTGLGRFVSWFIGPGSNRSDWLVRPTSITSMPVGWPSIFTSLESLTLEYLPPTNFKIVSEEDEKCSVVQSELLVSINNLTIDNCPRLVSLESLHLPPRLKKLSIFHCPNLRNLPYGLRDLTSLKEINFWECPVLGIRPHHPLPPSITHISIRNCRKLQKQRVMEERDEWKGAFGLIILNRPPPFDFGH